VLAAVFTGDNYILSSSRKVRQWFIAELSKYMIVNVEGTLGTNLAAGEVTSIVCLNRIISLVPQME